MSATRGNRRKRERRACSLYMQFVNSRNGEPIGDVADISREGFMLECVKPIQLNMDYSFRVDLSAEISTKPFIVLIARSRWSRPDPLDGRLYDTGFEIIRMDHADAQVFEAIYDRFGSTRTSGDSRTGYVWRR
jgi:PilZ domain-containing protein